MMACLITTWVLTMLKNTLLIGLCLLCLSCSSEKMPPTTKVQNTVIPHSNESAQSKGMRYLTGHGLPQNNEKAFYWLNVAAHQGNPFAQNQLGYLYSAGIGVKSDPVQALKWYQKAADQDLASAQYTLGLLYLRGVGTEPNSELANVWFKKAASHGFEPARQALR